jgi:hypothetical protein
MKAKEQERKYRALWNAVLMQALLDAKSTSKKAESLRFKAEAICWVDPENENFIAVCEMANIVPDRFIKKAKKIKNNNEGVKIKNLCKETKPKKYKTTRKSSWYKYDS